METNAANYLIIIDDITESGGLASPAFVVRGHDLGGYGADAADELMAQVLVEELSRRMGIEVFPLPAVTGGENTSDGLRREPGPVEDAERDAWPGETVADPLRAVHHGVVETNHGETDAGQKG